MAGLRDKLPLLLGAKTAKALATALDIETVSDLLRHYPRRYAERGELTDIAGLELGEHATVLARIEKVSKRRMKARNGTIIDMVITDGKRRLTCAFFNQAWREKDLVPGKSGLFAGKVSAFRDTLQLTNPEYELFEADREAEAMDDFLAAIIPVYPAAQGMPTWSIAKCVRQVLDVLEVDEDPMPAELRRLQHLGDLENALRGIHRPENWAHLEASRKRLKWDEAMAVQLIFAQRRHAAISRPAKANPHVDGGIMDAFDKRLPFDLTAGQRGIGDEIATDLATEHPMNRLLQGEVGSGKTIVALRAMLQVVDNGRQAALLAPTEVLAAQHARSLREMLGDLAQAGELGAAEKATRVTLLTGSMGAKERKKALLEAVSGEAGIIVGTHALIQETVQFADLGLAVVDEQHRFGVEQRDALRTRGSRRHQPARAGDDRDADPAHGRDDRLRRPGDLRAARDAGRAVADQHDRRAGGGEAGVDGARLAARHAKKCRQGAPGLHRVPADRRRAAVGQERQAAAARRPRHRAAAGGGAAQGLAHRRAARPDARGRQGRRDAGLRRGRAGRARGHHRDRGRRQRAELDARW